MSDEGNICIGDWVFAPESDVLGPAMVLAIDDDCPDPRGACWIRYDPTSGNGGYRYRSVDLADLRLPEPIP